ncbi:MAG TPA: GNAT family N-acetyltransferase, partial [Dehalococcoidia bacterium]|nr:GNAT family N-acetyltransferase [Dehalococcoidia bacterium]
MGINIRPIAPDEFLPFARADSAAFGFEVVPERMEDTKQIFEFDRTLAAFDGEEIVGTTAIFSFTTTTPGGALPTAGVTWVSVKPTHRRQGILTQIMRRQLSDVRQRGEPIASLWASESLIYGRFGYGLAAEAVALEIEREHTRLGRGAEACGRCRLIDLEEALRSWPRVYDRVLPGQPGMYSRSETWWRHKALSEFDFSRQAGTRFFVQYEEDGEPLGYARYRVKGDSRDGVPNGTLMVQELMAATDGAYAALWRYLFGIDLVGTVQAHLRRVDEPLVWMLADPRRLVRRQHDSLWVRIVDVPAALEGRRYSAEGKVVFDVRDSFCPWVEGRYELEGGAEGARCRPSDAEPEIALSAADLGA